MYLKLRTLLFFTLLLALFALDLRADELRLKAGISAMKRQHYATALRAFRAEAEEGNSQAKNNIGYMYEHGGLVGMCMSMGRRWPLALSISLSNTEGAPVLQYVHVHVA